MLPSECRQDRPSLAGKKAVRPSPRSWSCCQSRLKRARSNSQLTYDLTPPLISSQGELRSAEMKLGQTNQELEALSMDFLKKTANHFREFFLRSLGSVIQGTIQASPAQYGETLETEQLRGGSFLDAKDVPAERWERIMDDEVGNAHHRLFGGAQYHRALREFTLAVRLMKTPVITEDEIANAAGVGDMHDGVNFMRAACVIAVEKVGGLHADG